MKTSLVFFMVLFLFFSLSSCKKDKDTGYVSPYDVYVAGVESNGTKDAAKYWKNSTPVALTNGLQDAEAKAIILVGSDIYVAGTESNGTHSVLKLWKNGTPANWTDGTKDVEVTGMAVSGADIYISGHELDGKKHIAKYWKNGAAVTLSDGTHDAYAESIFVKGTDIYVAGYELLASAKGRDVAKYWKNGVATVVSEPAESAQAHTMAVVGADVLVAGTQFSDKYRVNYRQAWRNGSKWKLNEDSSESEYTSSFVDINSDVVLGYNTFLNAISGNEYELYSCEKAAFTGDGGGFSKPNLISYVYSVFSIAVVSMSKYTDGTFVTLKYCAGVEVLKGVDVATYWDPEAADPSRHLTDGKNKSAAYSIFVVKK